MARFGRAVIRRDIVGSLEFDYMEEEDMIVRWLFSGPLFYFCCIMFLLAVVLESSKIFAIFGWLCSILILVYNFFTDKKNENG